MGKFSGILICTDLDGTFLVDAKASRENCEAIRYFQENGGLFTVATGRAAPFVRSFENYTPNAPLIVSNGTMICDNVTHEVLKIFPMPEYTSRIVTELEDSGLLKDIFLYDLNNGGTEIRDHRHWHTGRGCPPGEFFDHTPGPWLKMLCQQHTTEDTHALQRLIAEKYPGMLTTSMSYSVGLELHATNAGKGACVDGLRSMLPGIRLVVGAGDYENDISLIRHADIGYAVENALPEVKAAADRITVPCEKHAIAQIIADIEREFT